MQVVYVAGPYRADTVAGIVENIGAAKKVAEKWWKDGFAVFCPHLNSALMDGIVPDEAFLAGDLEIMKRCDILVMVPGWEKSAGARAERDVAKECGLLVAYETEGTVHYEA